MSRILLPVLSIIFAAQTVWAGQFEDGRTAYDKGEYATAFRLWQPLAVSGQAEAQNWLGAMYQYGEGVPRSQEQAIAWYRKAADQGHARAQYNLGEIYRRMHLDEWFGNRQQARAYLEQAANWYRKAADQDVVSAQMELAFIYDYPNEPPDYRLAALWYGKAADRGNSIAQSNIARLYEEGKGVPRDYQQAYFWFLLASDGGNDATAKRRDQIELRLTAQERSAAQAQARSWKPMPEWKPIRERQ